MNLSGMQQVVLETLARRADWIADYDIPVHSRPMGIPLPTRTLRSLERLGLAQRGQPPIDGVESCRWRITDAGRAVVADAARGGVRADG